MVQMQRRQKGMEESMWLAIVGLQRRIDGLERELSTLGFQVIDGRTTGLFAGL